MKKILIVFSLFLFVAVANAQWIQQPFETCAADTFFHYPDTFTGLGTGTSKVVLSDNATAPTPFSGSKALKIEWTVHSSESWGGFAQLLYLKKGTDSTFEDFGTASTLELHYYNAVPSDQVGMVRMRFKIHEAGGAANYWADQADHEDWYFETGGLFDTTVGWKTLVIPLIDKGVGSPSNDGFYLPGWSGRLNNGVLDFDKVVGYSLEFTTPGIANNGIAHGTILYDQLTLKGNRYDPITNFDGTAADTTFFVKDVMSWVNNYQGYLHLKDSTQNAFEGASSLKIDYQVENSQSWGGYVNMAHRIGNGAHYPDLSARTELVFYVKRLRACNGTANRVTLRFMLFDDSEGQEEQWYHNVDITLYGTSDWQRIKIPLDMIGGDPNVLSNKGFKIPGWEGFKGNNLLNLDKITGWKFEFSGTGDFGTLGEICNGSIMVDIMQPGGFRETDVTPPLPPTGLSVVAGTFVNIITWNDVPNETQEVYNLYYSLNPITDVNAPGVEVVKTNIAENVQLGEHLLRAPVTNQNVAYYYAINAIDKAGNIGQPAKTVSATTNMAKGVVTISLTTPNNFVADGNLQEWANIPFTKIATSDGSGFVAPNTIITNDADLSVKSRIAVNGQYLFVAMDVEDDIVSVNPAIASYLNDSPDLFLGLYNFHGKPHGSYQRGAEPDYHFRFYKTKIMLDGLLDSLMGVGAEYYWGEKFPTGYVVEARIPLALLAQKGGDSLFVARDGMRIPIDYSINDADATGTREGILCLSPYNQDQSWATPSRWLDTWVGSRWTVGVKDDNNSQVVSYSLDQNYPNPFNPSTQIKYSIEKADHVSLRIYDVLGRLVTTLVDQQQNAGTHSIQFNASNFASGLYFYSIESGSFRAVKKMMLVK